MVANGSEDKYVLYFTHRLLQEHAAQPGRGKARQLPGGGRGGRGGRSLVSNQLFINCQLVPYDYVMTHRPSGS